MASLFWSFLRCFFRELPGKAMEERWIYGRMGLKKRNCEVIQ